MPILGTRSYDPRPDTAFPRPYVTRFALKFGAGAIITQSDEQFFVTDGANPFVHVVCNLMPQVWTWDNNGYTLDFIVKDWYLLIDPDPTPQPLAFLTSLAFRPADFSYEIIIAIAGATTLYEFTLPGAPAGYWLHNPSA